MMRMRIHSLAYGDHTITQSYTLRTGTFTAKNGSVRVNDWEYSTVVTHSSLDSRYLISSAAE